MHQCECLASPSAVGLMKWQECGFSVCSEKVNFVVLCCAVWAINESSHRYDGLQHSDIYFYGAG